MAKPKEIVALEKELKVTFEEVEFEDLWVVGFPLIGKGAWYALSASGAVVGLHCQFIDPFSGKILLRFPELNFLVLTNCNLNNLSTIGFLTKLVQLSLGSNQIKDLKPLMFLTGLTLLWLEDNQIENVTPLKSLAGLTHLVLNNNQIEDVTPLAALAGLTHLDLESNQIKDVTPLAALTALTTLNLGNNQIQEAIPLATLTALTTLDLYNNQIREITSLATLTALTTLTLDMNHIREVVPLANLTGLTQLRLENNQIEDVAPITNLTELTELWLGNNQIEDVAPLAKLTELTELWLGDNQIEDVAPLANLTQLTKLGLESNQIKDITLLANLFHSSFDFDLSKNPLVRPPLEIVERGNEAILAWFDAQVETQRPLNETKVLLVGAGGAGKTSLVKAMLNCGFDPHEPQTHGIIVEPWHLDCSGREITVHLWDFGGQEMMHATHQFFLSRRSLYLLLLDGRREVHLEEYWLKMIESFGGDSPILVVLSKSDENPAYDLNRRGLMEKYPSIVGFYPVSSKKREGLQELITALSQTVTQLAVADAPWPDSWFRVKQTLQAMSEDYIDESRYRAICVSCSVTERSQQETLLDFLHDLGICLHYPDLDWLDTQVLKPNWVTTPVYDLINHRSLAGSRGLLQIRDLGRLLPEFPRDCHRYLEQLMAKFEICHPVGADYLLFPDLLPASEQRDLGFDPAVGLHFSIKYHFLPRSILARLMVRLHADIAHKDELRYQWRNGVVFRHPELQTRALVQVDYEERRLNLQLDGKHRREYLGIILRILRDIHSSFQKIEPVEKVRCICPECQVKAKDHEEYDYPKLLKFQENGFSTIPCMSSTLPVAINDLLNGTYLQQEVYLTTSDSKNDQACLTQLKTQLAALGAHSGLKVWDRGLIQPGTRHQEVESLALTRAKLAVVLVSSDYLAERQSELKNLLQAKNRHHLQLHWFLIRPATIKDELAQIKPLYPNTRALSELSDHEREAALAQIAQKLETLSQQRRKTRN